MPKSKREDRQNYRIVLPEASDWSLQDLYVLPHTYEQCYTFVYCLDTQLPARDEEAIDHAFERYPWKGGYSYVNFYQVLRTRIPPVSRPRLASMHKASPGWIELALNLDVAVQVAKSVALISGSLVAAAAAYKKAWTLLLSIRTERQKARNQQLQLRQSQVKAIRGTCEELAKCLGFKSLSELHNRTNDPEVSLKLLAAHYRKMRTLYEYESRGKIELPVDDGA
jgi:hypothetical protein